MSRIVLDLRVTSLSLSFSLTPHPPSVEQSPNCHTEHPRCSLCCFQWESRRARVIVPTQRPPFQAATCGPLHQRCVFFFFTSRSIFFRLFRGFKSEGKTSSPAGPLPTTQEGLHHMIGSSTCRQSSLSTNLQQSSSSKEAFRGMCEAFPAPRREEQPLEKL